MKSIILVLLLFTPSLCLAIPNITSISGNLNSEETITIKGSGFGSNGPKIILFDDFSAGNPNQVHSSNAIIGNWDRTECIVYPDSNLSKNQGVRCIGSPGQLTSVVTFPTVDEIFVSSTVYIPPGYKFPSATATKTFPDRSALKHFWFMYSSDGYKEPSDPDIVSPTFTGAYFYRVASNDYNISSYDTGSEVSWVWNEPMRWSIWAKGNGTSASGVDGMFQGVSSAGYSEKNYDNYKSWFNTDHAVKGWDRVNIIGYARSDASFADGHNWIVDDVYIAVGNGAAARVEIGDSNQYTSCKKLALFTPTSWSDSQITATVRQGRFSGLSQSYLYITDANGNVNNVGYPITLGETIDGGSVNEPIPNPPSNLQIN